MSAAVLLDQLARDGVAVNAYKGDIVYVAPPGVMTPERVAGLREHKAELLALLTPPAPTSSVPDGAALIERMRELGFVPNQAGPGWVMTPERAAMCAHHSDRPLAPGDKLFCQECRSQMHAPIGNASVDDRVGAPRDDRRHDPPRCAHCGDPEAADSLLYCSRHRAEQRERLRSAFEDRQRRGRR